MKIAIIGCGSIGQKRAKTLVDCELVACVDIAIEKAQSLASHYPACQAFSDWQVVMQMQEVDCIIVSTLHATLAEIALAAVKAGKHVLMEKPGGRKSAELTPIIEAAKQAGVFVRVGFNHRYHRSIQKAKALVLEGVLGELMFVRARYGHGGRIGYDKEWRADPALSGGGELIDQGVHLIDLARWFLGDFKEVDGFAHTYFWDMPVDDNGFMLLKTASKQVAFLHASCTEWKNLFSFEIYGKKGKLAMNGLGGSYGLETISFYKMSSEMGPPETFTWEYPMADNSWELEMREFMQDIRFSRQPEVSLQDAQAALNIVEEIYRKSSL